MQQEPQKIQNNPNEWKPNTNKIHAAIASQLS